MSPWASGGGGCVVRGRGASGRPGSSGSGDQGALLVISNQCEKPEPTCQVRRGQATGNSKALRTATPRPDARCVVQSAPIKTRASSARWRPPPVHACGHCGTDTSPAPTAPPGASGSVCGGVAAGGWVWWRAVPSNPCRVHCLVDKPPGSVVDVSQSVAGRWAGQNAAAGAGIAGGTAQRNAWVLSPP